MNHNKISYSILHCFIGVCSTEIRGDLILFCVFETVKFWNTNESPKHSVFKQLVKMSLFISFVLVYTNYFQYTEGQFLYTDQVYKFKKMEAVYCITQGISH